MKIKDILLIIATTFLIIVGSYISVPIGPVPFVLTNFFIVLLGLLLGWRITFLGVATYIILGIIGFPVFSQGRGGFAHIIGVTGGFILGFLPLALISGLGKDKSVVLKLILSSLGTLALFLVGVPWAMWVFNNIVAVDNNLELWTIGTTLKKVMIPFLLPDLGKIIAAIILSKYLSKGLEPFIKNRDE